MPLEKWSDSVVVVHVADDPQLTEDLEGLDQNGAGKCNAVIDFAAVHFLNSSNIAKLLKLRRQLLMADKRLILCNVNNQVWSTFLVTGLDKVFEFSENVPTGLATVQMSEPRRAGN